MYDLINSNKEIVNKIDNILLNSSLVRSVDIEIDVRNVIGYFFTISDDDFMKILEIKAFDILPKNVIKSFLDFYRLYQNEILFRVEVRGDDIETLLGFEKGDNTFTIVINRFGIIEGIKFYCNASDNHLHYKFKFNKQEKAEEVYKNYNLKNDIWFSVCTKSVYTEILDYNSVRQLVPMIQRTKKIFETVDSFQPSVYEKNKVFSNTKDYLANCANEYSELIDYLLLSKNNVNISPNIKTILSYLNNQQYKNVEELLKNEYSVNYYN